MTTSEPQLRNALKKLRRIDFDRSDPANTATAPQEMLDFLAMLAGMKPVCLIGRGFEDGAWVAGVASLASTMNLHIIRGPTWCAEDEFVGLPDWYRKQQESDTEGGKEVLYICRSRSVATSVVAINAKGETTIEQEAALLGYPVCCVRDDHSRQRKFHEGFFSMVQRTAGGVEAEMRRIIRENVQVSVETDQEIALMEEAERHNWAPFTSVSMCPTCAAGGDSPAAEMSRRYEALARSTDPDLALEVEQVR